MKTAIVFPGQGSQALGLLAEIARAHPQVKATFEAASAVTGYDLWAMCQHGPEAALHQTEHTQPVMLAAGVAMWRVWEAERGPAPMCMAGHSLGEYTALVCAGAIELDDAMRLVIERGRLMQEAVPAQSGGMAAILGLDDQTVRAICDDVARQQGEVVQAVNFNSPGQVVVAGMAGAVERALERARESGARRAIRLPVSVPSHCMLMKPAADRFAQHLQEIDIRTPSIPVIHNVDVSMHAQSAQIADALARQLYNPVRWVETVRVFPEMGVHAVLELGPGKVLTGLNRRIAPDLLNLAVHDPASLSEALSISRAA